MELKPKGLPKGFDIKRQGEKPVVEFDFKENIIEISYVFPGLTISRDPQRGDHMEDGRPESFHHEVGISGTGFFSESGKPMMPSFGRFVQIPLGYDYEFEYKKSGLEVIEDVKLKPAQENANDQDPGNIEWDDKAYNEDKFYPYDLVECSRPLFMDAYRVLCIHVRPIQYNPKQKLLHCYSNIKVAITLLPEKILDVREVGKEKMDLWAYLDRSKNLQGYGNFLFNPSRTFFDRVSIVQTLLDDVAPKPEGPEFLILYEKDLEVPARKLKEWKIRRGLETEIICKDKICGSDGNDIIRIKDYIRKIRRKPFSPLRYVLLFGDTAKIPTEKIRDSHTDHYFYTHRDAINDSECLLPWISGGRIPVRTESEGISVVDQIIRYEKDPPYDPQYYKRMTVSAYFEDCDEKGDQNGRANKAYLKTMERIREHMISYDFEVNRVYVTNNTDACLFSDGSPVPADVKKEMIDTASEKNATQQLIQYINEGQLIVGHRDHGRSWGWSHPPFKLNDLESISSGTPSIFFSINCLTGSFERKKDCFAEDILTLKGGAPSLIASTEVSGAWRNDSMIKALFDAIWPGLLQTFPFTTMRYPIKYFRLGDILNYAKAYLLISHGVNQNTQKHIEIYHVMGDPTLHLWGDEPLTLKLHTRLAKDMLVITMNTCPEDAVLSVWYDHKRLMKLEPTSTRLVIPLMLFKEIPEDALSPASDKTDRLAIYFSAPGHRMAESTLQF
jgi:hypothetical protein